ncbi:hypothetical protein Ga0076813_11762 [endosymbiont of Ridgeia piscesae]|jgi:hypothetical protein|uniref:Transposase n=1 Tax=endosymbiont of Ridgeia piscesae TaxID=54398 RepID=A0A0T5Z459_9GAMM|nr:hypothetical protein Ga0076813_11762 [endosymbiont of Ridgeia piscesae]
MARLDRQCERLKFKLLVVGLDAGYNTAAVCHGLMERGIDGVVGHKRPHTPKGQLKRRDFSYDARQDVYHVPRASGCAIAPPTGQVIGNTSLSPSFARIAPYLIDVPAARIPRRWSSAICGKRSGRKSIGTG